MSGRPLFRAESERARSDAWLGRIVLIRPISFAFLTAVAFAMALALAGFFIFGEYTRKARVLGVLAPNQGVVKIIAPQAGVVESVRTREGASISRDSSLFVLGDPRTSGGREEIGPAMRTRLEARRSALLQQREHASAAVRSEQLALAHRRGGLQRELEQLDLELSMHASRTSLTRHALERATKLAQIGFLSPASREREEESALDQMARLEATRRTRLAIERELAAVEFEITSATSRASAQRAALDLQIAALEQERFEREVQYQATIVAPAAGTIAAVLVESGQPVTAGMTLATIIPTESALEAHLYAPSRSIGFVREGQEVLLRYLAYPYQKFGSQSARVVTVSKNPLPPGELGFAPPDGSREPVYRIKAELDSQTVSAYGRPEPLQAGMQIEADIHLDRRRLIEWVFEPLLSLAGRA